MRVFRDVAEIPAGFGPSVVAIGKFDGVHAGHRAILRRAAADAAGRAVVAVTFDRNPLAVIRPAVCPDDVVGLQQKLRLLEETGIDAVLVLRFDATAASEPAEDFVRRVLVGALSVRTVLVGRDFRFGHGGRGTPDLLRGMGEVEGFSVDVIDDVAAEDGGRRVSSTWVRELLADGDVDAAARLLGRPHAVWGEVVRGLQRGRQLGYPTANLAADAEGFVPADGVYAGWLVDEGTDAAPLAAVRHPAAVSVGTNPTFDDVPRRVVEAHVLDRDDLDLYGHRVSVEFVSRVRAMAAFDGVDALTAQMARDVEDVRRSLTSGQEHS